MIKITLVISSAKPSQNELFSGHNMPIFLKKIEWKYKTIRNLEKSKSPVDQKWILKFYLNNLNKVHNGLRRKKPSENCIQLTFSE